MYALLLKWATNLVRFGCLLSYKIFIEMNLHFTTISNVYIDLDTNRLL